MLEPDDLLEDIVAFFQPKVLAGKRVLLTAGPTFEAIDPVRGITNLSSGKTGFALARAARDAGAEVTVVAGPTALATPRGVRRVDVSTAQQMFDAVMGELGAAAVPAGRADGTSPVDVFIGVAAVADWRIANPSDRKIKKNAKATPPALQFEPNVDILAAVAALPHPPYCVGFAAESEDVVDNAKRKLASKKVQLVVGNRAQETFGADRSELFLVDAAGVTTLEHAGKLVQARRLIAEIAARLVRR
jgi:phosphopantothenoylcysteine decarboxylase/phosphopantothenate--cysteine ligase